MTTKNVYAWKSIDNRRCDTVAPGKLYSIGEVRTAAEVVIGWSRRVLPPVVVLTPKSVAVRSDSDIGYYLCREEFGVWSCSCPNYDISGSCKHLARAKLAAAHEVDRVSTASPRTMSTLIE